MKLEDPSESVMHVRTTRHLEHRDFRLRKVGDDLNGLRNGFEHNDVLSSTCVGANIRLEGFRRLAQSCQKSSPLLLLTLLAHGTTGECQIAEGIPKISGASLTDGSRVLPGAFSEPQFSLSTLRAWPPGNQYLMKRNLDQGREGMQISLVFFLLFDVEILIGLFALGKSISGDISLLFSREAQSRSITHP